MSDESLQDRRLVKTSTPGVYKRGGRYVVVFRDAQGKQVKRAARTLAEARVLKSSLNADVERGEYRGASRVTFREYAATWIENYAGRTSKGVREETRADYRKRLEQDAIPFLGKLRLSEIEPRHIDELAAKIASRGVKPNTVRLSLAPVKAMLATAHGRGDIRSNPLAGYRTRYEVAAPDDLDEEAIDRVKALSEDELTALLAQVPEGWQLFFAFLSQTGLRIGEAIEVRWRDLDLGAGTLRVRRRFYRGKVAPPKSKYGRRQLRLSRGLSLSLWTLRKNTRAGDDDLVFTSDGGQRIEPSNLMSRVLKPAAANAGIGTWVKSSNGKRLAESWVGFHTFRHSCATVLFRRGWNAVQVQRWLGHHKPSFTLDTYVHLLETDVPAPDFFDALTDQGGNTGATSHPETSRNDESVAPGEFAGFAAENLGAVRSA
jgi:integrase